MGSLLTDKAVGAGLPIYEATEKFVTNLEVKKAIAADPDHFALPVGVAAISTKDLPHELEKSLSDIISSLNLILQSGKVVTLKIELLLRKLRSGKLKAFGFPLHDKLNQRRVEIPEFLLHAKYVKHSQSQIVGYDKKYVDVLIVQAAAIPNPENTSSNPKIGRPQIKDKIQAVIRQLDAEHAINPALSVKAIGELIFSRGRIEFPNDFYAQDGKVKPGRSTIEKEYNKYKQLK